ncbi:hypothetical protein H5410_051236 [Solanum commersonii]|uniref:Uncharacterized protein n=1 Tax=Solanum commersonii TaxID=4109 RepID=A0A9J5WXM7_SOLCO|nr:hypothetical protein H5410_051236 [Solanum commersonii]
MMAMSWSENNGGVETTNRGPARDPWEVAMGWWLGLHNAKARPRAFPRTVVKTTGREVARGPWSSSLDTRTFLPQCLGTFKRPPTNRGQDHCSWL